MDSTIPKMSIFPWRKLLAEHFHLDRRLGPGRFRSSWKSDVSDLFGYDVFGERSPPSEVGKELIRIELLLDVKKTVSM